MKDTFFPFHLKYFFFFFVNITRSCVTRMILSAVCASNFFQAIFFHVVRVLFTTFGTCLCFFTGFLVVSIFLAFEAPQECWDVLLNPLKTIADFHLLGSTGLLKFQNVSVSLDSFFAFSNGNSPYDCKSLFSKVGAIPSSVANANSILLITPWEVFSLSCGYALHYLVWKLFIFNMFSAFLQLSTSTSRFQFIVFRFWRLALI